MSTGPGADVGGARSRPPGLVRAAATVMLLVIALGVVTAVIAALVAGSPAWNWSALLGNVLAVAALAVLVSPAGSDPRWARWARLVFVVLNVGTVVGLALHTPLALALAAPEPGPLRAISQMLQVIGLVTATALMLTPTGKPSPTATTAS